MKITKLQQFKKNTTKLRLKKNYRINLTFLNEDRNQNRNSNKILILKILVENSPRFTGTIS